MPLIVRYPKEIKAGSVNTRLGMNIDFGPTMLDYAGVAIPSVMQGVSLRPLLQGNTPADWRTSIFYSLLQSLTQALGHPHRSLPKLIRFPTTPRWWSFTICRRITQEMYNRWLRTGGYRKQIATTQKQLNSLMTEVGVTPRFPHQKNGPDNLPNSLPASHKKRKKRSDGRRFSSPERFRRVNELLVLVGLEAVGVVGGLPGQRRLRLLRLGQAQLLDRLGDGAVIGEAVRLGVTIRHGLGSTWPSMSW